MGWFIMHDIQLGLTSYGKVVHGHDRSDDSLLFDGKYHLPYRQLDLQKQILVKIKSK